MKEHAADKSQTLLLLEARVNGQHCYPAETWPVSADQGPPRARGIPALRDLVLVQRR
jgi:hypothetical protein